LDQAVEGSDAGGVSMKPLIYALLNALPLATHAQIPQNADPLQWVFLNTGSAREKAKGLAKEELSKM
jgi:hypothetical protein